MSASSKKKLRKELNAEKLTEKQLTEQKEAKKLKGQTIAFVTIVCLVVVLAIGIMGTTAFNNSGILERNTDALTFGEHTLNNAELNYYFIDAVNNHYNTLYNQYGDYASMFLGFDPTKPLNTQPYGAEENKTYADYFKDLAIANASSTLALYNLAMSENHTVSEEAKASVETTLSNVEFYAMYYGYANTEDYIRGVYGNGATEESFKAYLDMMAVAQSYQTGKYDALTYTADEISAHNKENFNDYSSFSFHQFLVNVNNFIQCTDPDNSEHTHSAEEISAAEAAAKSAAEMILELAPQNEEDLNKAINMLSIYKDATTPAAATYRDDVFTASITEDVATWLAADGRVQGDLTMIPVTSTTTAADGTETTKTTGYYIVLFGSRNDNTMPLVNVRHILSQFEGGKTDEATGVTTYTDEEKQKALDELTLVQDGWLATGGTEDGFKALVKANTDDPGSADTEGLYEDVYPGQMVTAFNDWCFDQSRKSGDYGIVETEYGYHLMYYVGQSETIFRDYLIENDLRNQDFEAWYTSVTENAKGTELNTQYLSNEMILSNG